MKYGRGPPLPRETWNGSLFLMAVMKVFLQVSQTHKCRTHFEIGRNIVKGPGYRRIITFIAVSHSV